ncbi:MAG: penicillin-binding protein 2 [Bacillota bacterium]|nr:penicillin-binding protein 2 [Bacillota bacterium]
MPHLQERRISLLFFFFLCTCLLLGGRLAYLQLLKGKELAAAAVEERILRLSLGNFLRGDIRDCRGKSLLDSQTTYVLAIFPDLVPSSLAGEVSRHPFPPQFSREEQLAEIILGLLPLDGKQDEMRSFLMTAFAKRSPFFLPVFLNREEAEDLKKIHVPGFYVITLPQRYGPAAQARHLIGYVKGSVLKGEPLEGVKGIEILYDNFLAPTDPQVELLTVIDRQGRPLEGRGLRLRGKGEEVGRGKNVVLTIDGRVQGLVEKLMDSYQIRGAVALLDIPSGEVRALASRPQYDQNTSSGDQFDRSLALYHPGSVFKIVVAAAALAEGKVRPEEKFFCPGKFEFNEKEAIGCWQKEGHGSLNFREAFASSCNTVFVEVALRIGRAKLEHYARILGLEEGLVGYPALKKGGMIQIGAYDGQLGNAALGQEGVRISPLTAASLAATIGRGGIFVPPKIVKEIRDDRGSVVTSIPQPATRRVLPAAVAAELQKMMELTIKEGTGKRARVPGLGSAGKTGSVETVLRDAQGNPVSHAWFVGYAPVEFPQVAVAVFIEGGGTGGTVAAEIFRKIMEGLQEIDLS